VESYGVMGGGDMDDEPSCWQHSFHRPTNTNLSRPQGNDEVMVFIVAKAFDNDWSSCGRQKMMEQCCSKWPWHSMLVGAVAAASR